MASTRTSRNARLAAIQAQQQAADRRRRLLIVSAVLVLMLVIIGGLVVARLTSSPAATVDTLDTTTVTALTAVPAATFDAVGVGTSANPPRPIVDGTPIDQDGRPRMLYVGAEFCPYCALERYAVVVALSRFGTFADLGATQSDPADGPAINTVSFHGSSYTSEVLAFTGVETSGNTKVNGAYPPLGMLTAEDQAIVAKYNQPPYVQVAGSIPWIYYNDVASSSGASIRPDVLVGKTQAQIASEVADPATDVSQAVVGSANVISAQVCVMTKGQPAAVCDSPGVEAGAAALAS